MSITFRKEEKKLVKTKEDWYPTHDGEVQVSLLPLKKIEGEAQLWRVCIWGGDDFGMEKDFLSRLRAKYVYDSINESTIAKSYLKEVLGFQHA